MREYQRKYLDDGSINPRWRPDTRRGDRHAYRIGDRHADRTRARSGRLLSKWERGDFVAWDGEGANIGGVHQYVLLCNSEGLAVNDPNGLDTYTVLRAMLDAMHTHKRAVHVGFFFSYDCNMIFRDIDRELLAPLWAGEWVWWRGINIQWRANKTLSLSAHANMDGKLRRVSGTIWDVGGFFQSAFVTALRKYDVTDAETIQRIAAMKLERPTFSLNDLPEITRYCQDECKYLVALMAKLREHFDAAGIRLRRWDGAGAAASALLDMMNIRNAKLDGPRAVIHASQHAYFGGRVELLQYGHHVGPVYHYDINSAYPSAIRDLPCLACGAWHHYARVDAGRLARVADDRTFAVVRVTWDFPEPMSLYPFPWRRDDGAIFFPSSGEGWYWMPEILAARAWMRRHKIPARALRIHEAWRFARGCAHTPFAFVPTLYDQRRAWKAEGNGAEKAAKLALNSLYGKMAQRVGHAKDSAPSYHQLEWAGWITSATRAKLLHAVAHHDDAVIAFATDAVYALAPLDLPCSDALGEWDGNTHTGGTWVQSGVYWIDDGERVTAYSRGFDRESLRRDDVLDAWKHGRTSVRATLTRFIGLGSCINAQLTATRWEQWRTWDTSDRVLRLTPEGTKRVDRKPLAFRNAHKRLIPTWPASPANVAGPMFGGMSAPIALPWSDLPGLVESPTLRAQSIIDAEAAASVS